MLSFIVPDSDPHVDSWPSIPTQDRLRLELLASLPATVRVILAAGAAYTGRPEADPWTMSARRLWRDGSAALDFAKGPGSGDVLAVLGWLDGRRSVIRIGSVDELRTRWDEVLDLILAARRGISPWHRRRERGWSR